MSGIILQKLNLGDTQEDLRNKINENFDSLVSDGGGPRGKNGIKGNSGSVGGSGKKGDVGAQGLRGTKWFVSPLAPIGGTTDPILIGDYWIQTATTENEIFEFTNS